ncbi:MAG TPA: sugar ABC transporter permease, partial [Chloroflexia bacterium]|nr:sugar ABC transporter permease [Chloroflexia bacterium]
QCSSSATALFWDQTRSAFNAHFFFAMGNTLLYTIVCLVLFLVVGLGLALLLKSPYMNAQTFFRTLIILPGAAPAVLSAPIWEFFFDSSCGPIAPMLRAVGVSNPPNWRHDQFWSWVAVVIVNLWLTYPYFMFIILDALASGPADMYEAAQLHGAGWWTQLFRITIPLIPPAILPALILSAITTFQMFNTVWIITAGEPFNAIGGPRATEFVMVYAGHNGVQQHTYGLMSAFAVVVFDLLFVPTMINTRIRRLV